MSQEHKANTMLVMQVLDAAVEQGVIDFTTCHPSVVTISLVFDHADPAQAHRIAEEALERINALYPITGDLKYRFESVAHGTAVKLPEETPEEEAKMAEHLAPVLDTALEQITPNLPTLEDLFAALRQEAIIEVDE